LNEDEEQETLIGFNKQRKKTSSQIYNESNVMDKIITRKNEKLRKELVGRPSFNSPKLSANLPTNIVDLSTSEERPLKTNLHKNDSRKELLQRLHIITITSVLICKYIFGTYERHS
jgi:hypothetical protein